MNSGKDELSLLIQSNRKAIEELRKHVSGLKKILKVEHRINLKKLSPFHELTSCLTSLSENNSKLLLEYSRRTPNEKNYIGNGGTLNGTERDNNRSNFPGNKFLLNDSEDSEEDSLGLDLTKHKTLLSEYRVSLQEFKSQNKIIQELVRNSGRTFETDSRMPTKIEKTDESALTSCIFSSPEKSNEGAHVPIQKNRKAKDLLVSDLIADFEKKRQKQKENMSKIERNLQEFKKNKNTGGDFENKQGLVKGKENRERNGQPEGRKNSFNLNEEKKKEKKVQKEISEIDAEIKHLVFKIKDAFSQEN